ncbi:MAG: DMT family transporter [Clostridia bacterium]|nr:DMT family transporter [Clostridia bacterium]
MMKKGYIYILITAIIFSTMEIAGKIISDSVSPYQITFIRFLIGSFVLLPFAIKELRKRKLSLHKEDFAFFFVTGFLCVVVSMSLFQSAVLYTKASTVAIVFSTNPVFTIPFACLLLKEKLTKKTLISLLVSFLGILFIMNPLHITGDFIGMIYAILSAITFSLYSVVSKKRIEKYGGLILNCATFIFGDVLLLIMMKFRDLPIIEGINASNISILLYLGIVITGIGFMCYFLAMEKTSASMASMAFFMKPALASIFAFIILGEIIPINAIVGIVFIVGGAFIATYIN